MKRALLLIIAIVTGFIVNAQLLSWSPPFPKENDPSQSLVITIDATKGNQGLLNYAAINDVYVHIGVITNKSSNSSDWKHVPFTWGSTTAAAHAIFIGNNKWTYTITGSLRTFFNITDATETILKIAILFRNGDGSKKQANTDNSDMYIPVYNNALAVWIFTPPREPRYTPVAEPGSPTVGSYDFGVVVSNPATVKMYQNATLIGTYTATSNNDSILTRISITAAGNQQLIAEANDGSTTRSDTINFFVAPPTPVADLPAGVRDGINYEAGDTSVTLVLRAPGKTIATVIGDFNNWTQNANSIMNKTPDGKFFWIRIHPLAPGTEYAYQYVVDNSIKIADPYTEKILDPNNDPNIPSTTYPNLKTYPAGQTGIASVLRTGEPAYNWTATNFSRPDKRSLVVYELLVRDFVAAHDWKTVTDSLNYLKTLGVNAIEVMPFNEFEGNNSWGYNPDFYFAPDKYYGTKTSLKTFIDSCHKKGIAVIMDIVLNHTYGPSPLKLLYYNSSTGQPASNNPWYNVVAPHAFGFGDDFNHESADTKYFFNRVLQHWMINYKIDGYRFDFSKGLTQKPSTNDATFSAYDASRIANIMGYYNAIKAVDPNAYLILEHFCDNTEEKELADSGMLIWGNLNDSYAQAAMGYTDRWDFSRGIYTARSWTKPHLVTYMESHDEERIVYKNINFGNSSGSYNIRDTATALKRMELDAAFLFTIPGPKMIWQFGELGYPYSINTCTNLTVNDSCRLTPKPIRWDYLNDSRRKSVYNTYSSLINLRFHPWYKDAFITGTIDRNLAGSVKWIRVSSGDTSHLLVVGNFDVIAQTASVTFPTSGTWFDYLNNTTLTTTGSPQNINLNPGEFHLYVSRNVNNVSVTPVVNVPWNGNELEAKAYPNPALTDFTIELDMPQSNTVQIDLYTTSGQYVSTLYQGFATRGIHQLAMKRKALLSGTYYARITTKTAAKTIPVTFQ